MSQVNLNSTSLAPHLTLLDLEDMILNMRESSLEVMQFIIHDGLIC